LKRRTVALFEFVNQHKAKSWGELFGVWNKIHRDRRFRDRSHLFTTYMRALEYIAGVKPTGDEDGKPLKVAGTDQHGRPSSVISGTYYTQTATPGHLRAERRLRQTLEARALRSWRLSS
jgi:hypothetical protein